MKTVVLAMPSDPSAERLLRRTLLVTRQHDSRIVAVHAINRDVFDYSEDRGGEAGLQQRVAERLNGVIDTVAAGERSRVQLEVCVGSPWKTVLAQAESAGAKLIAIGTHRLTPLQDVFLGTTAERVIRHSPIPVLALASATQEPYGNVLACVEYSPPSARALRTAAELAPDAMLTALHAFDIPFPAFVHPSAEEMEAERQRQRDEVQKLMQEALSGYPSASVLEGRSRIEVRQGLPETVIHQAIDELKPDLISLGVRVRSGIASAVLGSIALALLNNAPTDLLLSR